MFFGILVETACVEVKIAEETNSSPPIDERPVLEISMSELFLPNKSKAHYKGEGNEFAELDVEVTKIDDIYTMVDEDNGGTLIRKIYRIKEDRIEVIFENGMDFDEGIPTVNELEDMAPLEIFLQKPFKEGTTFGKWTIVEIAATVETPYKTFQDAIVIEMSEQDFINRKYLVEGFGEVKREAIQTTEGVNFTVTSLLESVSNN